MEGLRSESHFCVIADDLTGAMDTGVGLALSGLSPVITFTSSGAMPSDAVVVTTDSRAERASEAYRRVKTVGERFRDYYIYKKIDSTLRGNVAAELQALLDVTRAAHAVVCPSFPAIRRTVVNGELLVDGIPVSETSFSRDPVSPVTRSSIVELLRSGSGIPSETIGLGDVECGPEHLATRISECSARAVVVDATEEKHLRTIAEALVKGGRLWLPCGSGGLGAHIPAAFGYPGRGTRLPESTGGHALFAVGSRNEVSVRQLTRLLDELKPSLVPLEPHEFRTRLGREPRMNQIAREVTRLLRTETTVVLSSSLAEFVSQYRRLMAPILGAIVGRVLSTAPVQGLFLSGGDVARAVCGEDGIQGLRILGDLQPGVIVGEAVGQNNPGLRVVTKAGGFGNEDAMIQAARYLAGENIK
jgi:uncharacterized protein YgbK (DUF1537 family)